MRFISKCPRINHNSAVILADSLQTSSLMFPRCRGTLRSVKNILRHPVGSFPIKEKPMLVLQKHPHMLYTDNGEPEVLYREQYCCNRSLTRDNRRNHRFNPKVHHKIHGTGMTNRFVYHSKQSGTTECNYTGASIGK